MKKILISIGLMISLNGLAQKSFDVYSAEIIDPRCPIVIETNITFVYFPTGFTLISDDKRFYSFFVTGVEFWAINNLTFYDTGKSLNDTIAFSKQYPIEIYKSTINGVEIAQQIDSNSITLIKRNSTGIKFLIKK